MSILAGFMVPHPPLIVPEIGRGQERGIRDTADAYGEAAKEIAALKPETVVLASPHSVMYADYFHISPGAAAGGSFAQFGAGGVAVQASYDVEFVDHLCRLAQERRFMAGMEGERDSALDHATLVPLYFLNQEYRDYRLVRIGLSGRSLRDHYTLGQYVRQVSEMLGRRTVFIASGDLSHKLKEDGPYGFREEGPVYDRRIMEVMEKGEFGKLMEFEEEFLEKAAECGHRSFTIMAGALDRTQVESRRLSYEGPFGVGYGICTFHAGKAAPERAFGDLYDENYARLMEARKRKEDEYVRLARLSLETYVKTGRMAQIPSDLPPELLNGRAGAFVSLKKNGRLRGCIGTIQAARTTLAEEIVTNAVSSGLKDPRFPPVTEEELGDLVYSVDVLGDAEPVSSLSQLDPKRYGVIVTKGYRRGLLLPDLEGVDTVEEQISIARQKAGIGEDEDVRLERFEVIRHR